MKVSLLSCDGQSAAQIGMCFEVAKDSALAGLLTLDAGPSSSALPAELFELADQQQFTSGLTASPLSEKTAAKTDFVLEKRERNSAFTLTRHVSSLQD